MTRVLALVDGEHYPEVVRAAFAELPYEVIAAVSLGGSEKLRGEPEYGVPLYATLGEALERSGAELVLDLSDEPVVDPRRRFRLASVALAAGVPYAGADFRLEPVPFAPFALPSLAVIGTGKRVGKTAVSGRLARLLSSDHEVVVVAMGRGGPADPTLVANPPGLEELLALSRSGVHAASDYLEDAALAGVVTIGCRRCGGGLAGAPGISNVEAGARLAASLGPDIVVFEGSGAAIPPIATDRRVLVAAATQDPETVAGFLGSYRLLVSDLVVLTMCETPPAPAGAVARLRDAIADVAPDLPVVATVLRPSPTVPVRGRRIAYLTTAPDTMRDRLAEHLALDHGADVVLVSTSLARRDELRRDLATAEARGADVFLVEIKAAALDVVAETAASRGIDVVFADNEVCALPGEPDLDAALRALVPEKTPA
jgi:cyclic 2,3-diphosphoglycerate synthetase